MTGRPVTRAAIAERIAGARASSLEPNPPPTCGETIRTALGSSPNAWATLSRTRAGACVVSYSVSRSSSQTASAACGSIGLLCVVAVVYVRSTLTGAAANAASKSPSSVSVS